MAIRASNVILIYFVIGAVMFGGGAVSWDNTGPTKYFLSMDGGQLSPAEGEGSPSSNLQGVSGAITSLVGAFGGPAILVWNLVTGIVTFFNWPIIVLLENSVPPRVTVLLGGSLTVMFYVALIRLVRSSA